MSHMCQMTFGTIISSKLLSQCLSLLVCDSSRLCLKNSREEDLGFHLEKRKSRRVGPEVITDFDFADYIALLSEDIQQAQEL